VFRTLFVKKKTFKSKGKRLHKIWSSFVRSHSYKLGIIVSFLFGIIIVAIACLVSVTSSVNKIKLLNPILLYTGNWNQTPRSIGYWEARTKMMENSLLPFYFCDYSLLLGALCLFWMFLILRLLMSYVYIYIYIWSS